MFENKTEAQAREEILAMVAEYADRFHNQTKEFSPGDRIPYASRVYDKQEMVNLVDSSPVYDNVIGPSFAFLVVTRMTPPAALVP